MNTDADVQPNGVDISPTVLAVNEILFNSEFAAEVREHNNWVGDLSDERTALLFLAARYQWTVELLSRQTVTLKQATEGLERRLVALEGNLE
ncbi:hypothetical protein LCGC14_2522580 [marine sediment metagenome]|uniref:Uncharacterized protein n=1 Tax=marine sediment metagenome TaxID=412755 RepID=A0A0F9BIY5_9ZZZZ